jgi:nitroreductase
MTDKAFRQPGVANKEPLSAFELLTATRSVRRNWNFDVPIERSVVDSCVRAANHAPSRSDSRPWTFYATDSEKTIQRVASIYVKASKLALAARERGWEQDPVQVSSQNFARSMGQQRCLVFPVMQGRPPEAGDVFFQASLWGSVFPAVWSFCLACRLENLGTIITTMGLLFESDLLQLLGCDPSTNTLCCVIPVGTLGDPKPRIRKLETMEASWLPEPTQ